MKGNNKTILRRAAKYVTRRLIHELPHNRIFHNLHHTLNVERGAKRIGTAVGLGKNELQIVRLAAWFHDIGHIECYKGHEGVSKRIAAEFLTAEGYSAEGIAMVVNCIEATSMPQHPRNLMEQVLCDADLCHLASSSYPAYQEMLRVEWHLKLGIAMTDNEWNACNDKFLNNHTYFTAYGKQVLEPRKPHQKTRGLGRGRRC